MRRRALLSALGATAVGLAGCLDGGPSGVPAPETNATPDSTTSEPGTAETDTTTTGVDTPETTTEEPSSEFVRCAGDSVSAERAVTDETGYDDNMKYFPENETVRIVVSRRGDSPASFGTMSFEEWASIECAEAALERVREVTADRLGTDEFGSGMGVPPEFAETDEMVVRLHVATRVEDGETVSTPSVSRDRLAEVAPGSVKATVSLDGDEFSRTVPVFAEHVEVGLV